MAIMTDPIVSLSRFIGPDGVVRRVRVGAYAWCERDAALLVCRLGPGTAGEGRWTLPGGGVKFGEDPAAAVLRELGEETGLAGRIDALLGVRSAVVEPAETRTGHRIQTIGILYGVTPDGSGVRTEVGGSTDAVAWIPLADLDGVDAVPLLAWARETVAR